MNAPLDELYLTWLYSQIGPVKLKDPSRTYWKLARKLFTTEFVWWVANDDNRAEDGKDLRYEFIRDRNIDPRDIREWLRMGCSFLELLIGLSRRLSFEDDREPRGWFWRLIDNLDLESYSDSNYTDETDAHVDEVLHTVNFRLYRKNGRGGLFPLEHPKYDQREVELWYQLNAYLLENEQ